MSYQVLARKWRPRTFAEVVGQEHVLRALANALAQGRLHHAYLFTGTRGVGKTTLARILARCLNCERGVSAEPCGECASCREILEGRFADLIELDAASHTGVDNMREILENAQYAPVRGRYKVYLIDEVHMLSKSAFNAMLKTLEEPPGHVVFLLATTDPQRLPVTVLSRCLQFHLKHLPPSRIADQLARILTAEGVPFEEEALRALARAAAGSLRDALTLTDQAIAHGGGALTLAEVEALLGTVDRRWLAEICRAVAAGDGQAALSAAAALADQAPDFDAVLAELAGFWHRVALAQTVPEALDPHADHHRAVLELARTLAPEEVQLYYQIALLGRRDLPWAPDPRSGFEMVVLRLLAFRPEWGETGGGAEPPPAVAAEARGEVPPSAPSDPGQAMAGPARPQAVEESPAPASPSRPAHTPLTPANWPEWCARLDAAGLLANTARNLALERVENDLYHFVLDEAAAELYDETQGAKLAEALGRLLGKPVRVAVRPGRPPAETPRQAAERRREEARRRAVASLKADPLVCQLGELLGAELVESTVRPLGAGDRGDA